MKAALLPLVLLPFLGPQNGPATPPTLPARPSEAFSFFSRPLYLGEAEPECFSVRHIHIGIAGKGVPADVTRTKEEAAELAAHVHALLTAGEPFAELARQYSCAPHAQTGGVMGTFPIGSLVPQMDGFLRGAKIGGISDPIESPNGYHIIRRISRFAGCRQIFFEGRDPASLARAREVMQRLRAGEDFAELARAHSDHKSAPNGGAFRVFERGPRDAIVKKAAFDIEVGQISPPVESQFGYHVLKRVPVDEIDPADRENNWARARAILISHAEVPGATELATRSPAEAASLAKELYRRLTEGGEDFAELARQFTDEPTARARAGDLGWLYRQNQSMAGALAKVFTVEKGVIIAPTLTKAGWLILRRE